MTKPKLPPRSERNNAIELFWVLHSISAYAQGPEYDWDAGETAAMILLSRLGLAAPIREEDDDEDTTWVLTIEGNERLAELIAELRQWDPNRLVRESYGQRVRVKAEPKATDS